MANAFDVLICVVGAAAGEINFGADRAIGRSVAAIRPHTSLDQHYCYCLLITEVLRLREESVSSAQGLTSRDDLAEVPLPLPPLAEQRRIVAKIDALTTHSNRARVELAQAFALIARTRAEVLSTAFAGQLTTRQVVDGTAPLSALDDEERGCWAYNDLPRGWSWRPFDSLFADVTDSLRKLRSQTVRHKALLLLSTRALVLCQTAPSGGSWATPNHYL
jgi:hypothetical protein